MVSKRRRSRRSVEHVPEMGRYQASVIMIPSCRAVICLRSRTVSPLPVAQRIRREVSQSVETQTEHKLPGGRDASAQAPGLSDVKKKL
jgi:hypothetical protein